MQVIKVESENVDVKSKGENGDHLIAVVGLDDIIITHSKEATIIAKKDEHLQERLIDLLMSLQKKE